MRSTSMLLALALATAAVPVAVAPVAQAADPSLVGVLYSGINTYMRRYGFDYTEHPNCTGGYGGHIQLKRELLRAEGLDVAATRVRRFGEVRWPRVAKAR